MDAAILLIDDEPDVCELLSMSLKGEGARVTATTSVQEALDKVAHEPFDLVLTDLGMSEMDGLEVCRRIHGTDPSLPVIVITGAGTMESAILAMRAGAYDYIPKPIEPRLLAVSVARAIQHKRAHAELRRLRETIDRAATPPGGIIGASRAIQAVHSLIARVGVSDAAVLIQGETGVGKELVARRIHEASARPSAPFVAINCAAVAPSLLESELFGHARGAFTDARSERVGLFVQANGGTLFLDEIGELPIEIQPKLLRALQERTVRPVGSNTEVPFDARLITATNRNLETEVQEKRFREDLDYRIHVVRIDVPPLRERDADILLLARHFLAEHAMRSGKGPIDLSPEVAEKLMEYTWPGNVRELENCIARATAFARFEQLTLDDLPEKVRSFRSDRFVVSANDTMEVLPLAELERRYILRVLALFDGNKSKTAHVLGIDRRTLYRRVERWSDDGAAPKSTAAIEDFQ